jgi:hypothetical protein
VKIGFTRRSVARAAAILVVGALAACASMPPPSPAPSSPPDGSADPPDASRELLVLLGTPGHMRLSWMAGNAEVVIGIPDEDGRWVCGSPSRGLVMTVGPAGRILASGPFSAGHDPAWQEIPVARDARQWLGQPLADAVGDAAGGMIAVVAADAAAGFSDGHLVIVDPSGGPSHALILPGRWDGRAPAWLGSGRVAISTRDVGDATALTILDLRTGLTQRWGTAVAAFAVSGDAQTIAWQDGNDRRVLVGPLEPTLAGASPDLVPPDPDARLAAQLLLDATGRRLGVAWLDDAGDTRAYSIYERGASGWALLGGGSLPAGVSRAVLVSLGP